ncbi:hypothetical protein AAKU67_004246 [Oxalobacteraceae bacterium GrIS 2.11]
MLCKKLLVPLVCFVPFLTACVLNSPEFAVDWQHGAKLGWIVSFYIPETPGTKLPECLAKLPKAELASRHFVTVRYHHVRQMFYTIAELPATMQAKVNDQVELWAEDCSDGKISRISRTESDIFP